MKRTATVLAILAASSLAPAHAAVVTFDDAAGQAATGVYYPGDSFSDGGLTFTYSGSNIMYLWDASGLGPAPGSNGTNTLLVGSTSTDHVTITATGGGLFSISSLLLGINEPATSPDLADAVLVNGTARSITPTATAYTFSLNNVASVTISGLQNGGFASLDNITYQVPEPVSLSLLGVGMGGLALLRRRQTSAAA